MKRLMDKPLIAGAKVTEVLGVDISGIDPETSVALTRAVLAKRPTEVEQRIVITWPTASRPGFVDSLRIAITDADTGAPIVDVTELSIAAFAAQAPGAVVADLTRLLHEDGTPLGGRSLTMAVGEIPTGLFRHVVAEMRIAEA